MTRSVAQLIMAITIIISAVSCNKEIDFGFKDLCFYHPHTAPVQVNVDWSKFKHIENPTGMTAYAWPENQDETMSKFITHNLSNITLDLKAGKFDAFVFNQSASEYATLEFYKLDDFHNAEVRVTQTKANWYTTKHSDTKVGTEPEWLAIDSIEDIEVTEQMVLDAEAEYLASMKGARGALTKNIVATLVPKSIIKSIDIYIHIDNIIYLNSALGALEHMAEGCYISSKKTTANHVTHAIDSWGLIYDKDENGVENKMKGVIKATITTFGNPSTHQGLGEDNNLLVRLLLIDNKTILEMNFPVGDQLANLNDYNGTQLDANGAPIWPEIHVYWPEPLPEVKSVGGDDGGFNVGIGDWGEDIITILPLL